MYIKNIKLVLFVFFIGLVHSESVLIKNATIYDGKNNDPFVGNVLIEGDKISRISKSNLRGDIVIDASGKIVTPGIIATDSELGIVEIGALSVTRDDSSDIYKIGFSIYDAFNPHSVLIPWNRSNGITSSLTLPARTSLLALSRAAVSIFASGLRLIEFLFLAVVAITPIGLINLMVKFCQPQLINIFI